MCIIEYIKNGTSVRVLQDENVSDRRLRTWKHGKIIGNNIEKIPISEIPDKNNICYTIQMDDKETIECREGDLIGWGNNHFKKRCLQIEDDADGNKWVIIGKLRPVLRKKNRICIEERQREELQKNIDNAINDNKVLHDGALYSVEVWCEQPDFDYIYNAKSLMVYPKYKTGDDFLYEIAVVDGSGKASKKRIISGRYKEDALIVRIKGLLEKEVQETEKTPRLGIKEIPGIVTLITLITGFLGYTNQIAVLTKYIETYRLPNCKFENVIYLVDSWQRIILMVLMPVGIYLIILFVMCVISMKSSRGVPREWENEVERGLLWNVFDPKEMKMILLFAGIFWVVLLINPEARYRECIQTKEVVVCQYNEMCMAVVGIYNGSYYLQEYEENDGQGKIYNDYYVVIDPESVYEEQLCFEKIKCDNNIEVGSKKDTQ